MMYMESERIILVNELKMNESLKRIKISTTSNEPCNVRNVMVMHGLFVFTQLLVHDIGS